VINNPPVYFLGDSEVKAAVASFHMEDRHLSTFGGDRCQATVRVA
jgi:hypothetical protein